MKILHACCAGLDVHKKSVTACVLRRDEQGSQQREIRPFPTTTQGLLHLSDWLEASGCSHVAMESTGVYWKPIYNLLEGTFELMVVNAQHLKAVPGRKTDVKDAEWIADLLQHGLLRASFIPSAPQRELRELTRYRSRLTQERAREINRLQKTLEDTNLKLGDVVSDVLGKASRFVLQAIVDGETDPERLASFAVGRVRASQQELEQALTGKVNEHHRFMLREHLSQIDSLDAAIGRVTTEIARRFEPPDPSPSPAPPVEPLSQEVHESRSEEQGGAHTLSTQGSVLSLTQAQALVLLVSIPGISERMAQSILAEIGTRMQQFPSPKHLASWAGVCPGNRQSAGKRLSGKTRQGNPYLRALLVQAAHSASRQKNSYLAAQYHRLAAKRGKKRAVMAVAHSLSTIIYHLLSTNEAYHDLGGNFFDERDRQAVEKRLVRRLEHLGYQVELHALEQEAAS